MEAGDSAMVAADSGSNILGPGLGHGHEHGVQEWEAGSEERRRSGLRRLLWWRSNGCATSSAQSSMETVRERDREESERDRE